MLQPRACFVSWDEDFIDAEGDEPFDPDAFLEQHRDTEAQRKAEEEIGVANSALPQGSQSPSKSEADSVRSANSEIGSPNHDDQRHR
ncbi:MAG: hypothetical protein K0B87_01635 [Candidatus Syntrophosphaera sp.]|nr:hypothetical protein [Candidatus Syntrophosphaera sp.]